MGAIRVTQRLLIDRILNNLNTQSRRILELQEQLSTGLRVNKPSDDPLAARRAINAQAEIARNEQFMANIASARPPLIDTEAAMTSVVDLLQRASELALQGSTGTVGQAQRDQIATEINQLLESGLVEANRITRGRYVFGGTRTTSPPFVATRNAENEISLVTYEGNEEFIEVEISEGARVAGNAPGSRVFGEAGGRTVDIFQELIDLRDSLRSGDVSTVQASIDTLSEAREQILVAVARVGAIQNRLDETESNLDSTIVQLRAFVSDNIDVDFAELIVDLNAQSNAFQASLNASARVIQPSLLDFVR